MTHRLTLAACIGIALAGSVHAADDTRYIWANSLVLRTQPDGKSAEVARLPYGAAVTLVNDAAQPVPHREVLFKLSKSERSPAAELALEGNWRHVKANGGDGWVFDGYLSRYPARHLSADRNKQDDEDEGEFAKRVFGVKAAYKWKSGDGKKSEDYRALIRDTKMTEAQTGDNVDWTYIEFKGGGSYRVLGSQADGGMFTSSTDFRNVPLTYGEALLWLKQFGGFAAIGGNPGALGKFAGKVEPGKHLELSPADDDDSGFGFSRSIDCTPAACSISEGFAD
jgi:hypothetical protein